MGSSSEIYVQASVLGNTWQVKNFSAPFERKSPNIYQEVEYWKET